MAGGFNGVVKEEFLPETMQKRNMEITFDEDGDVALINGKKYPLLTDVFTIRIVQGSMSKDPKFKGHDGELYIDGLEEFSTERILVPITVVRFMQAMYNGPYDPKKENKAVCYSFDGIAPSPKLYSPLSTVCGEIKYGKNGVYQEPICPKAVWGPNGEKPECRKSIVLAFLDITDPELPFPLRMALRGSGYAAWTKLQRMYNRVQNVARLKRQNAYDYALRLTVEENETYYVPVFTPVYDESKPSKFIPMCAHYLTTYIKPNEEKERLSDEENTKGVKIVGDAINTAGAEAAVASAEEFEF